MDLSSFVTYDKKESLLLSIAKSNQEIVENTHSKPQETLEFKMTKQKESFSFDVPLLLPEKWMMGVTSLEVYNTVYNITEKNNKLQIILNDQQLKELKLDSGLILFVEDLYVTYFGKPYTLSEYNEFVEKANKLITNSYSKKNKLTRIDFDYLTKIVKSLNEIYNNRLNQETINQEKLKQEQSLAKLNRERIIKEYKDHLKQVKINWEEIKWEEIILEDEASHTAPHEVNQTTQENHEDDEDDEDGEVNRVSSQVNQTNRVASQIKEINLPPFDIVENDFFEIYLTPGVYELVDINNAIKQKINESDYDFKFDLIPDTISMKSVLTTSNNIQFNSKLNTVLGFTHTVYPPGTHTSEKPVMITTTDKVHLKCDCVDGSIVNGIREQILFSFNLSAPPGYKIIKEPTTVLYKSINKTRLDTIQFFLEDSNHDSVDFNGETLTFTIQIIKI